MPDIVGTDTSMEVRPPRQERTRKQWARVLDAGLALFEAAGYDGFTIPALCDRANVPPRALYARAASKEALFLAVYEHGMRGVAADEAALLAPIVQDRLPASAIVLQTVQGIAEVFERHRPFLRAVVLTSGGHPEVARRGQDHAARLAERFGEMLRTVPLGPRHRSRDAAESFAFSLVFSTLALRTAYGPAYGAADVQDLAYAVERYLCD